MASMLRIWLACAIFWQPVWALGAQMCAVRVGSGCQSVATADACGQNPCEIRHRGGDDNDCSSCRRCPAPLCEPWAPPRDAGKQVPLIDLLVGRTIDVPPPAIGSVSAPASSGFDLPPPRHNARHAVLCVWTT